MILFVAKKIYKTKVAEKKLTQSLIFQTCFPLDFPKNRILTKIKSTKIKIQKN